MIQFSSDPCENKSNKRWMKSEVYTVSRVTIEPHLLHENTWLGRWSGRCALYLAHTLAWFSVRQDILQLHHRSEPDKRLPITLCEFVICSAHDNSYIKPSTVWTWLKDTHTWPLSGWRECHQKLTPGISTSKRYRVLKHACLSVSHSGVSWGLVFSSESLWCFRHSCFPLHTHFGWAQ